MVQKVLTATRPSSDLVWVAVRCPGKFGVCSYLAKLVIRKPTQTAMANIEGLLKVVEQPSS